MTNTTITASLTRLRISLSPSQKMLRSDLTLSFLFLQADEADGEEDGDGAGHEPDVPHHQARPKALGVRAQARVHVVRSRPDGADERRGPLERRHRLEQAG